MGKRISFCSNIRTKSYRSITLFEALNSIRTNIYGKQIEDIRRRLANGNIQSYCAKKKQLPAHIFTGIAYGNRYKFDISGYTSLMVVDIDRLEDIVATKEQLIYDKYVISVWESPSGKGLKALFYVEYTGAVNPNDIWIMHEYCAFPQIASYLSTEYGIKIDQTGADINRLCFVSSDPDIHLKKEFEPFPVRISINKTQIWNIRANYYYRNKQIRSCVTEMKRISRLLNADTN